MSGLSGEALKQVIRERSKAFVEQYREDILLAFDTGHNADDFAQAFKEEMP